MKESVIQGKILAHLKKKGFIADKIIVANRAGVLDIIACAPDGRYWSIEVKKPGGTESRLQAHRRKSIRENNAVAFTCYSYEEYLKEFLSCE